MKVPQCDWAPQLVVEWLSGELEERGIPGPTYAHTLLSLLHSQYCPHPPLSAGLSVPASTLSRRQSSRHARELNPRRLNLENLLEDLPHPDADVPDLTHLTALKCGGSRRARKRFRVRQKQRTFTSEELQKVSALQCLMSASDEDLQHYDLENLVEELCTRLKLSREPSASLSDDGITTTKTCASEESGNDTDESSPEELAQKYFAAFPPLSVSCSESYSEDSSSWKKGTSCKCVWDGSTPVNRSNNNNNNNNNKCHNISTFNEDNQSPSKQTSCKVKKEMFYKSQRSKDMESTQNNYCNLDVVQLDRASNSITDSPGCTTAMGDEQNSSNYQSSYIQEDIPEGYIGDTSSRESSEDRDNKDEINKKYNGRNTHPTNQAKKPSSWEEWECAGNIVTNQKNSTYFGLPILKGGGRLFERCSTSGGTSGCSSDAETGKTTPVQQQETDEESLRMLERKISDTVAQVWGQSNDQQNMNFNSASNVWNPPSMQELASFNLGEIFMSRPPSVQLNPSQPDVLTDAQICCGVQLPESTGWSATGSLFLNPLLDSQKDPLFSSAFCCSPNHTVKSQQETKRSLQIWPDYNANETTGFNNICKQDDANKGGTFHASDHNKLNPEEELKLCQSFQQQIGLSQFWNNDSYSKDNTSTSSTGATSHINRDLNLTSDNKSENLRELIFFEDDVNVDEAAGRIDFDSLVKHIPSGPSGPHPVLKHTESSGFSTVVPRKSAELFASEGLSLELNNSNSTSTSSIPGTFTKESNTDLVLPTKEEENLLTSPRTHFKPIRQDSIGQKNEETSEAGAIVSGFQPPELAFQRTGSGALFLESDILEGSPKKYMVYREPLCKTTSTDSSEPSVEKTMVPTAALIPKFKVINNEKFSQTERDQYARSDSNQRSGGFSFNRRQASNVDFDNAKYESNNFAGLSDIWKNSSNKSKPSENIWQLPVSSTSSSLSYEMWKHSSEVSGKILSSSSAWLKDMAHLESWSTHDQFSTSGNDRESLPTGIDIPKLSLTDWPPCKSLKTDNDLDLQSSFSIKSIWGDVKDKKDRSTDSQSCITKSSDKDLNSLDFLPFGSISESKLWGPQNTTDSDDAWPKNSLHLDDIENRLHPVGTLDKLHEDSKDKLDLDNEPDYVFSSLFNNKNKDDQMEENTENQLSLWNVCNSSELTRSGLVTQTDNNKPSGLSVNPSFWELPAKEPGISDISSSKGGGDEESEFLSHLWSLHNLNDPEPASNQSEGHQVLPIEDLDHLEPDWEMNEGFEWDQPLDDMDSDDGGCEVLIYEAEDGSMVNVPVEYLDDTLYDEIFGNSDKPIGGSLPDLPSGNSLHVQLPKKTKGGRWLPPSKRPCSFFMEGNCKRPDCKFSHDLASITCRFWEEGSCLKGHTCPFLHGYPLKRQRNRSEGSATVSAGNSNNLDSLIHTSAFEIDSEADFPSLSSSVESKRTTPEECAIHLANNGLSTNSNLGKSKKKNKFITITRNIIGESKSSEKTCRFLRRRAARRQKGQHRNSESELPQTSEVDNARPEKKSTPVTIKKLERHRATASGHDDGTVSDY